MTTFPAFCRKNVPFKAASRVPGDLMLHPIALSAVALLALNDHYLKATYGNWFTGKLSDFSGLTFFPLLLLSVLEIVRAPFTRSWRFGVVALFLSHSITALLFVSINVHSGAANFYASSMQDVWSCLSPERAKSGYVADPTDLLALPFLLVSFLLATRSE